MAAASILRGIDPSSSFLLERFEHALTELPANSVAYFKVNSSTEEPGLWWEPEPAWCPTPVSAGNMLFWMLCFALNAAAQPTGRVLGFTYQHRAALRASPVFYVADSLDVLVRWLGLVAFGLMNPRRAANYILVKRLELVDKDNKIRNLETFKSLKGHTRVRFVAFVLGVLPQHIKVFWSDGVGFAKAISAMFLFSWLLFEILVLAAEEDVDPRFVSRVPAPFQQFTDWDVGRWWSSLAVLSTFTTIVIGFTRNLVKLASPSQPRSFLWLAMAYTLNIIWAGSVLLGALVGACEFVFPSLSSMLPESTVRVLGSKSRLSPFTVDAPFWMLVMITFLPDLNPPSLTAGGAATKELQSLMNTVVFSCFMLLACLSPVLRIYNDFQTQIPFFHAIAMLIPLFYYIAIYDEGGTSQPRWLEMLG